MSDVTTREEEEEEEIVLTSSLIGSMKNAVGYVVNCTSMLLVAERVTVK